MKNLSKIILIVSMVLIGGYYIYQVPNLVGAYYTPPITNGIEFGFALYNDSIKANSQSQWVESGATIGRTQCTNWRSNQTDTGGVYTYNWNALDGCSDLDGLVNNGDIRIYFRVDSQGSGAPTVEGMTNYFSNTLFDPLAYLDFVKTLVSRYKNYTHYYTFNNEMDYNFTRNATTKAWNATAQNAIEGFIQTARRIKQYDPQAKICFNLTHADANPNPDFNPYKGLDALMELGGGNYIDCIDLHFYGRHDLVTGVWVFRSTAEDFVWTTYADRIKNTLAQYGRSDVELWLGESGIGSSWPTASDYENSVTAQSLELVKQSLEFTAQGYTKVFNVLLSDLGTACTYDWYCTGLLTGANSPSPYTKKSSFNVYKQMTALQKGTSFVSTSTPGTILQYRYASSTADIYAGYSNVDGTTTWSVTLDRDYTSGTIIDAIALTSTPVAPTSLQNSDIISNDVSTTTIKYIYLIK